MFSCVLEIFWQEIIIIIKVRYKCSQLKKRRLADKFTQRVALKAKTTPHEAEQPLFWIKREREREDKETLNGSSVIWKMSLIKVIKTFITSYDIWMERWYDDLGGKCWNPKTTCVYTTHTPAEFHLNDKLLLILTGEIY